MENEWIEHDGKGMPVDGETLVNVRLRDGNFSVIPRKAEFWSGDPKLNECSWSRSASNPDDDIVAYRVVKP